MNKYEKKEQKVFIVAIIAAIVLIINLFLPYITPTERYKERHDDYYDISIMELSDEFSGDDEHDKFYMVFFTICSILMGGFALITLIGAIKKKTALLIIFPILILGIILLMNWDLNGQGLVPSEYAKFGIGYYLYLLSIITSVATGIIAISLRKKSDYEVE